jgi:hypothetical protein
MSPVSNQSGANRGKLEGVRVVDVAVGSCIFLSKVDLLSERKWRGGEKSFARWKRSLPPGTGFAGDPPAAP